MVRGLLVYFGMVFLLRAVSVEWPDLWTVHFWSTVAGCICCLLAFSRFGDHKDRPSG
jgi:hypothetical protein